MITKHRMIITSLLGLLLATFGTVTVIYVDAIFRSTLKWLLTLRPNSPVTNLWQNPTLPVTVDIFLFNWTNPQDFYNHSIKPKFEEFGPYNFLEKAHKIDVVWHPENATVSYSKVAHFYFNETKSKGKLDDRIVVPNLLASSIYNKVKSWSSMNRMLLDTGMKVYDNDLTLTRTVDEWLFAGFDTPLLRLKKLLPFDIPDLDLPFEKIGYGFPRNGSKEIYGRHNVYTGADGVNRTGQVAQWRYSNIASSYPSCGPVKGSPGEFHKAPLVPGEPISYFVPDLCRELELDHVGTATVQGIEGFLYAGTPRTMANGTDDARQSCYCPNDCLDVRSGVMNISTCWYNTPIFASYPHYYNADPFFGEQVEGIKPNRTRHEMTVVLDPITGFVLQLKGRLMLSLLVEPVPYSSIYRRAPRTFMPLVWVDYQTEITPFLTMCLKIVPLTMTFIKIFGLICIAAGIVMVAWYPRKLYWKPRYMRKIEISNMETCVQAMTREQVYNKTFAEASPLLKGLEFKSQVQSTETQTATEPTDADLTPAIA